MNDELFNIEAPEHHYAPEAGHTPSTLRAELQMLHIEASLLSVLPWHLGFCALACLLYPVIHGAAPFAALCVFAAEWHKWAKLRKTIEAGLDADKREEEAREEEARAEQAEQGCAFPLLCTPWPDSQVGLN